MHGQYRAEFSVPNSTKVHAATIEIGTDTITLFYRENRMNTFSYKKDIGHKVVLFHRDRKIGGGVCSEEECLFEADVATEEMGVLLYRMRIRQTLTGGVGQMNVHKDESLGEPLLRINFEVERIPLKPNGLSNENSSFLPGTR